MSCEDNTCGVGGWGGPKAGDPNNDVILRATPAFGGIDVTWNYPTTNPFAVAYIILYRGFVPVFSTAIEVGPVAGGFYYDKQDTNQTYYYWIRIISINGTEADVIGPAAATARPNIERTIEQLTGLIDDGVLAQSLKGEIDKISLNYSEFTAEIAKRIAANTALSNALAQVQSGVTESLAFIDREIATRQEGQAAIVTELNTLAAVNQANAAAILNERVARVASDAAMASELTTAQATIGSNVAAVQTKLQTNINVVDGVVKEIGALYTAKVTVDGLVGGFGVYNDGKIVEAGFDVDRFWIGRTNANKRKPFIIENNEVFIDQAVINQLTFNKLRAEDGSFIVENGMIKGNYLKVSSIDLVGASTFKVKSAVAGARMEMDAQTIRVFDEAGVLRVKIGNLA